MMNRFEMGAKIYNRIKTDIERNGGSLTKKGFPKDYPVSLREIFYIRIGVFHIHTLRKLPFVVRADAYFSVDFVD